MSDFVICIDGNWGPEGKELVTRYGGKLPVKGKVYTIREIVAFPNGDGLRLEEIVNPLVCSNYSTEPTFSTIQFRPVQDSDLDIFREMLNEDTNLDRADLQYS